VQGDDTCVRTGKHKCERERGVLVTWMITCIPTRTGEEETKKKKKLFSDSNSVASWDGGQKFLPMIAG